MSRKISIFVAKCRHYHSTLGAQYNIVRITQVLFLWLNINYYAYVQTYWYSNVFSSRQGDNGLFVPKYYNASNMTEDMGNNTCLGPVISQRTKWISGFRFYP